MSESMKIELLEGGLDDTVNAIRRYLEDALKAKKAKQKDLMISRALGLAGAIYMLTTVTDESKVETQE